MSHNRNSIFVRYAVPTFFLALCVVVSCLVCTPQRKITSVGGRTPAEDPIVRGLDPSLKPCTDFYHYANGGTLKNYNIGAEFGIASAFGGVRVRNLNTLGSLAYAAARDTRADPNSAEGKVGSFYRSGIDTRAREAAGIAPLTGELTRIDNVHDVRSLVIEVAGLRRLGISGGINFGDEQDPKDSRLDIAAMWQGGLDLPERGYYLQSDSASRSAQAAFLVYATRLMQLAGEPSEAASEHAHMALALETKLAEISESPAELRDTTANYHPMTPAQLGQIDPRIPWGDYFEAIGEKDPGRIDVQNPQYIAALDRDFGEIPLTAWKAYLRIRLLNSEANRLSSDFRDARFRFALQGFYGAQKPQPLWMEVTMETNAALRDDLSQMYVQKYFSADTKNRVVVMTDNLRSAFRDDLLRSAWMSPSTRAQALAKLDTVRFHIGYPSQWRDYSGLDVSSPTYVINCMRGDTFRIQRELDRIGKPVDGDDWESDATDVNTYYDHNLNLITIPAGVLQPPFFDLRADDAANYGEIGDFIGHELTHAFDDQGRKFDAHGNMRNWWSPEDERRFAALAQGIEDQYSKYEPLPGIHIDGKLTVGENIADIGGLKISYLALERSLAGKPRSLINGLTPEQRFFISYAQTRIEKIRPSAEIMGLRTDRHSPEEYRVIGPLADMPEFRKAFGCSADANTNTVTIW